MPQQQPPRLFGLMIAPSISRTPSLFLQWLLVTKRKIHYLSIGNTYHARGAVCGIPNSEQLLDLKPAWPAPTRALFACKKSTTLSSRSSLSTNNSSIFYWYYGYSYVHLQWGSRDLRTRSNRNTSMYFVMNEWRLNTFQYKPKPQRPQQDGTTVKGNLREDFFSSYFQVWTTKEVINVGSDTPQDVIQLLFCQGSVVL